MCDYRRGLWVNATTNNYNTISISAIYSSQSVTRRFLVAAPTMAIPLPPAQVLSSKAPVQN
jgi:hypothetical protein